MSMVDQGSIRLPFLLETEGAGSSGAARKLGCKLQQKPLRLAYTVAANRAPGGPGDGATLVGRRFGAIGRSEWSSGGAR